MAFTLNQLAAIEAAIASGETSVSYDGKKVEYRSVADLVKARELVRGELIASGQLAAPTMSNRGPATQAVFSRD
jgi:hypothetical protein